MIPIRFLGIARENPTTPIGLGHDMLEYPVIRSWIVRVTSRARALSTTTSLFHVAKAESPPFRIDPSAPRALGPCSSEAGAEAISSR